MGCLHYTVRKSLVHGQYISRSLACYVRFPKCLSEWSEIWRDNLFPVLDFLTPLFGFLAGVGVVIYIMNLLYSARTKDSTCLGETILAIPWRHFESCLAHLPHIGTCWRLLLEPELLRLL